MKTFCKVLALTILTCLLFCSTSTWGFASETAEYGIDMDNVFTLEKEIGKDFVILQFTDLHINFKGHNQEWVEENVYKYMRQRVDEAAPDLICITGDGVNGVMDGTNSDMYSLIREMNSYCVPWTYVFGNHEKDSTDGVRGLSDVLQTEAERQGTYLIYSANKFDKEVRSSWKYAYTDHISDRYGNYIVNVEQKGKLVYSLFFMDSGREYETFLPSQETWYKNNVEGLSRKYFGTYDPQSSKVVPSMIFHHIPLDEYQYAANNVLKARMSKNGYTYSNVYVGKIPSEYGSGTNREFAYGQRDEIGKGAYHNFSDLDENNVEYAMYEDPRSMAGFFTLVKDLRSTTHMFCGHRHSNDATVTYCGVSLTFGTKTGRGNYEGATTPMGATVITIGDKSGKVLVEHVYD